MRKNERATNIRTIRRGIEIFKHNGQIIERTNELFYLKNIKRRVER